MMTPARLWRGLRWRALRQASRSAAFRDWYDRRFFRRRIIDQCGYVPDLDRPRTHNERTAHRNLTARDPLLQLTADKVAVRPWVEARIGAQHLIPLLGVWRRASDIDWAALPDRFAIKASHGSGWTAIVMDRAATDLSELAGRLDHWLAQDYYDGSRERCYRGMPRRIMAETLLLGPDGLVAADLKVWCMGGRPRLVSVHLDRFGDHRRNVYDPDLRLLPLRSSYPNDPSHVLPAEAPDVLRLAAILAQPFPFARIDFYVTEGAVWFGEVTHLPDGAAQQFNPPEWDQRLGDMWPGTAD